MGDQAGPHCCAECNRSFARMSHLKRHSRLHEQKGSYRCFCGHSFSRNDGLSRHLRRCKVAQQDRTTLREFETINSMKQTREKRACDSCAEQKLKCTSGIPCNLCRRKNLPCMYTRNGYVDPYERFRVSTERGDKQSNDIREARSGQPGGAQATGNGIPSLEQHGRAPDMSFRCFEDPDIGAPDSGMTDLSSTAYSELDIGGWHNTGFAPENVDIALGLTLPFLPELDTNGFSDVSLSSDLRTPQPDSLIERGRNHVAMHDPQCLSPAPLAPASGRLTVRQLDPLEAKCEEIRELLHGAESLIDRDNIHRYITREIVLRCGQLYGRHLSRNLPILHLPTFMLTEAPALLALAVTLGGACYDTTAIPATTITRFSKALLILIERQTHEIDMQAPQLSTVQASILVCAILLCSRHEGARMFASVHFARCISMADRLGLFAEEETVHISNLTVETFDWSAWAEKESRRRNACEIFCLDMAFCVFLGRSPSFIASSFCTRMPSHEICWEADDPTACLEYLQKLPTQTDVSTGICELYRFRDEDQRMPGVSEFGMFTLMLALHGSLLRIIQEEPLPNPPPDVSRTLLEFTDPPSFFRDRVAGESVALLADASTDLYGSPAMKQFDRTLKAWRRVWDQNRVREPGNQRCRPFSTDPLPFWYLAKLYQSLYLCDSFVRDEIAFKVPMTRGRNDRWEARVHDRIIAWLSDFRQQESPEALETPTKAGADETADEVSGISTVMNPYRTARRY